MDNLIGFGKKRRPVSFRLNKKNKKSVMIDGHKYKIPNAKIKDQFRLIMSELRKLRASRPPRQNKSIARADRILDRKLTDIRKSPPEKTDDFKKENDELLKQTLLSRPSLDADKLKKLQDETKPELFYIELVNMINIHDRDLRETVNKQISELQKSLSNAGEQIENLRKEKEDLNKQIQDNPERIEEYEKINNDLRERLRIELDKLNVEIENNAVIKENLDNLLKEIDSKSLEARKLRSELTDAAELNERLTTQFNLLEKELSDFRIKKAESEEIETQRNESRLIDLIESRRKQFKTDAALDIFDRYMVPLIRRGIAYKPLNRIIKKRIGATIADPEYVDYLKSLLVEEEQEAKSEDERPDNLAEPEAEPVPEPEAEPAPEPLGSGILKDQMKEFLSESQILELQKDNENFISTACIDEVEDFADDLLKNGRAQLIINTLKRNSKEKDGHWTALDFENNEDRGRFTVHYFDPLGKPAPEILKEQIRNITALQPVAYEFKENLIPTQNKKSSTCGFHAMQLLEALNFGVPWKVATRFNDSDINHIADLKIKEYEKI